jgi:predicted transport protein
MTEIGHYGTGHLEINLKSIADLEAAKPFLQLAYEEAGG